MDNQENWIENSIGKLKKFYKDLYITPDESLIQYVSFKKRFYALFIDISILFIPIIAPINIYFWIKYGQTVGLRYLGVKIISYENGEIKDLNKWQLIGYPLLIVFIALIPNVGIIILILSFLLIYVSKTKQGGINYITKTLVVYTDKNEILNIQEKQETIDTIIDGEKNKNDTLRKDNIYLSIDNTNKINTNSNNKLFIKKIILGIIHALLLIISGLIIYIALFAGFINEPMSGFIMIPAILGITVTTINSTVNLMCILLNKEFDWGMISIFFGSSLWYKKNTSLHPNYPFLFIFILTAFGILPDISGTPLGMKLDPSYQVEEAIKSFTIKNINESYGEVSRYRGKSLDLEIIYKTNIRGIYYIPEIDSRGLVCVSNGNTQSNNSKEGINEITGIIKLQCFKKEICRKCLSDNYLEENQDICKECGKTEFIKLSFYGAIESKITGKHFKAVYLTNIDYELVNKNYFKSE